MNIIHYTLGFPPHRTGGLTKYSLDLANTQRELGHKVYILYPGNVSLTRSASSEFKKSKEHQYAYKLTNALPVPLMYGTRHPSEFRQKRTIVGFDDFIKETKPDVVHIHTLMGLPIELIRCFKEKKIKIVFTSHDYFGLCPRVNFIDYKGNVCTETNDKKCIKCCMNSFGKLFLKIRNSEHIVFLKDLLK